MKKGKGQREDQRAKSLQNHPPSVERKRIRTSEGPGDHPGLRGVLHSSWEIKPSKSNGRVGTGLTLSPSLHQTARQTLRASLEKKDMMGKKGRKCLFQRMLKGRNLVDGPSTRKRGGSQKLSRWLDSRKQHLGRMQKQHAGEKADISLGLVQHKIEQTEHRICSKRKKGKRGKID